MTQQKKAQYEICPRLTDKLINQFKRADKSFKKKSEREILRTILEFQPNLRNSLDFMIFCEEYYWKRMGNHTIFPESETVLNNLVKAKYHLEDSSGIDLPFNSFILAVPQGYKIDGFLIPSCLVTWIKYQSSENETIFPFCDYTNTERPSQVNHDSSGENERSLGIVFRDRKNKEIYNRALALESKIPEILKAKNIEEFNAVLGTYSPDSFQNVIESEYEDLFIQFHLFKLIAALGVYNQATEGKRLFDGFPGSIMPKVIGRDNDQSLRMFTLKNVIPSASARSTPEAHVRTWFFRQLNNERYYRGEYEKMRRGSRYVFVNETVVGTHVVPHTQK